MYQIAGIDFEHYPLLLAPMEDVSDPPFRHVCKLFGADLVYSEFISSDGLIRDSVKSIKKLDFDEFERPFGVQIFGNAVEPMVEAAKYAATAHPDLIDINFGCPVKKVASKGAGSGIMNDIPKMVAITEAVVKAVNIPVTVKTRLGYDEQHKEIVDIAEQLQDVGIAALTIHGRLRTTKYGEPADWRSEEQPEDAHPHYRQRRRGGRTFSEALQGLLRGRWLDDWPCLVRQPLDFQRGQALFGDWRGT